MLLGTHIIHARSCLPAMNLTKEALLSLDVSTKSLSSDAVNGVESYEKQVKTPDPHWPYLNRWSSNLVPVSSTATNFVNFFFLGLNFNIHFTMHWYKDLISLEIIIPHTT